MICIYHHSDLDGLTSAAIMKLKYPDIKLIGYDYGEPFPEIPDGEEVMMADVCFEDLKAECKFQPMIDLAKGRKFTWIDHHTSAIKEYEKSKEAQESFKAVTDSTISACEGVWKYLFPDEEIPLMVHLLGKYDTFRKEDEFDYYRRSPVTFQDALEFQMGMRSSKRYSIDWICEFLSSHRTRSVDNIFEDGKSILEYQQADSKEQCKRAFETEFEGLRAICLNTGSLGSTVFDSVYDPNKHDVMIPFRFNGKQWIFSLYTDKEIDLSVIAKEKFGGGGHKKACGFQVNDLKEVFKTVPI